MHFRQIQKKLYGSAVCNMHQIPKHSPPHAPGFPPIGNAHPFFSIFFVS